MRLWRTDILHDVGNSINTAVSRGQVEGGVAQALGVALSEEVRLDAGGTVRPLNLGYTSDIRLREQLVGAQ